MADVLTGEYLNDENCIQSVILESELIVVVREKLYIHLWISIFWYMLLLCGGVERISPSLRTQFCMLEREDYFTFCYILVVLDLYARMC